MPSKSAKQHRFMELVAHDAGAAKRLGVLQSVGKDFVQADKREGKVRAAEPARKSKATPGYGR